MSNYDLAYRPKGKAEDNIARGLHRIADALEDCGLQLRDLGNAGAEGLENIATAIPDFPSTPIQVEIIKEDV